MKINKITLLGAALLLLVGCTNNIKTSSSSSIISSSEEKSSLIENSSSSDVRIDLDEPTYILDITKPFKSLNKKACPSKGNVKALVVPVHFSNDTTTMNVDLIKAGFDTPTNSPITPEWVDVKSFYKRSSYNKLNFDFTFTDTFVPSKPSTYYGSDSSLNNDSYRTNATRLLYKEILEHFDSTYDYKDYDSDKDGTIDCIFMMYDHKVDFTYKNMMWWAYTSFAVEDVKFDNVGLGNFVWCGLDFFLKDDMNCNTQTIIHETSHLFGVDDYYDYDNSKGSTKGGLGGADLMDSNNGSPCGDHNAYTKALLGWVSPMVLDIKKDSNYTLVLQSFQETGDCIILANDFNKEKEMFQEYFILEYYTPTNLSERDKPFTISGIRVLHVSSQLDSKGKIKYDNTSSAFKLISQINTRNGDTYINESALHNDSTLFVTGESLISASYNNEDLLKYQFEVIKEENNSCTVKFTLR